MTPDTVTESAVWQADLRLAVRGLPVMLSDQRADQYCPIQLDAELAQHRGDSPDHPVPLVTLFLMDPKTMGAGAAPDADATRHDGRARYSLVLRVTKLVEAANRFVFTEHLEQVFDWSDELIIDVGPSGGDLQAWAAWNTDIHGAIDGVDPVPSDPLLTSKDEGADNRWRFFVRLPDGAKALPIFGAEAKLAFTITDRAPAPPPG